MRLLQHWLHDRIPRWAWKHGTHWVQITPACRKIFSPWSDLSFLWARVPLEQVSRHAVVFTDPSATGWGATYNGHTVRYLDGFPTVMAYQLPQAAGSAPCLEPPQRAPSAQGHSGPYGQHGFHGVYQLARQFTLPSQHGRHLLLWSQKHLRSLHAIHIPGVINRAALPGEWRLHPQAVQLIWGMVQSCSGVRPSEPTSTDTVQDQGGWGVGLVSGSILAKQDLVSGNSCSSRQPLLPRFLWGRICFLRDGAPSGTNFRTCGNSTYGPWMECRGSRWPTPGGSTNYLFSTCTVHKTGLCSEVEPVRRMVFLPPAGPPEMLDQSCVSFLQQGLEHRLSPSTLKVYVAAISAHHDPLEGKSVGKRDLVVRFLRGASRLNPHRPPSLPSWDLALVLRALLTSPLSLCSQLSWSFCLWKPYSWLRWPRARGWGTCKHFLSTIRALSLGRLTPVQHWGPGLAMCPRFLPLPSGTR